MLVSVWYMEGLVEVTEELMKEMEERIEEMCGEWSNYILSTRWEDGHLHFFPDGPWEC